VSVCVCMREASDGARSAEQCTVQLYIICMYVCMYIYIYIYVYIYIIYITVADEVGGTCWHLLPLSPLPLSPLSHRFRMYTTEMNEYVARTSRSPISS
jgi:hypothetical protein